MEASERPETKEGFGEASLGEAQSENPPSDPEMIRDEAEGDGADAERGVEQVGGDQDAEPASDPAEPDPSQAEG